MSYRHKPLPSKSHPDYWLSEYPVLVNTLADTLSDSDIGAAQLLADTAGELKQELEHPADGTVLREVLEWVSEP